LLRLMTLLHQIRAAAARMHPQEHWSRYTRQKAMWSRASMKSQVFLMDWRRRNN
jgi:hypothetical protein